VDRVKERKSLYLLPLIAVLAVSLFSLWSMGENRAQAAPKESCVSEKCHSKMGKEKFVHGPVATGDCGFCHKSEGKHSFKPIKNVGALCYECHDKLDTLKAVHKPVKDGNCTGCHNPHQSPNKFQLQAEGAELCFRCHDKKIAGGKFVHGPVAVGSCSTCHNPHQTNFPKMLMAAANDVCYACHGDKQDEFKRKKNMHPPVADRCTGCHNPHSADFKFNLVADSKRDLCFTCHVDKKDEIAAATVKHGGLETDKKCLACHDPHVSNFPKLLSAAPADSCMACHDREYKKGNYTVANMKEVLANNKDLHGPIRQKDCSGCHNTHGSSNFRMLREYFPALFYAPYDERNYKLCFMCHEKNLAKQEFTTTMTNFRNGNQNLHFVHVNKMVKGRTCRACHDAHGTNNPKHVRDAVPFGAWDLPVNFQKTENGGKCVPGCHQLFVYDRTKMFTNR
jgi:predicted CXXCH cytochrome family protein